MILPPIPTAHPGHAPGRPAAQPSDQAELRRQAQALETAFLAEMLRAAGTTRQPEGMDGGPGEDQFASFMADAQARAMVAAGGLGLTEAIAASLAARVAARVAARDGSGAA